MADENLLFEGSLFYWERCFILCGRLLLLMMHISSKKVWSDKNNNKLPLLASCVFLLSGFLRALSLSCLTGKG